MKDEPEVETEEETEEETSEEASDESSVEKKYSYQAEVKKPEVMDGVWRAHDAFCAVVRRILKDEPDGAAELLEGVCDAHGEHLKQLTKGATAEDLGLSEPVEDY